MAEYETHPIDQELNPSEKIIWQGQPKQGFFFRPDDLFSIPGYILWFFAVLDFINKIILQKNSIDTSFMGDIILVSFILIGFYYLYHRFYLDTVQRKNIFYALTNQRVIIVSRLFINNIQTIDLKKTAQINLKLTKDGRGSIIFGKNSSIFGIQLVNSMNRKVPCFEQIEDAEKVYKQIKRVQRELAG